MNRLHRWYCRSDRWKKTIATRVPWVLAEANLGNSVLELGPGPGLTTDLIRQKVQRLTAIELDANLAAFLSRRLHHSNVEVITGNAAEMPFADNQFSSAVAFTMLHHVPSRDQQDAVLREVHRVLQPGATFAGSDSLQSLRMKLIHIGDTFVPVDPETFAQRLESAGFQCVTIERNAQAFRFQAHKPQ